MSILDLFMQDRKVVSVLPAALIDKAYSYALPEGMETLAPGTFVQIPLNNRSVLGVVWDSGTLPSEKTKLKEILSIYPLPPLIKAQRYFIERVADYTMAAKGMVLKMTLSAPQAFEEEKGITGYKPSRMAAAKGQKTSLTDTRHAQIIAYLDSHGVKTAAQISKAVGCSVGMIKTMLKNNLLETIPINAPPPCADPDPTLTSFGLSPEQNQAAQFLIDKIRQGSYSVTLLDGVTGSGKTEVYFEAVAEALKEQKQVLILLPEIALSNAFLDRFTARFGCAPALWHSALTPARRRNTWRGIARGETKVVVGARSALHLPYQNLGLMIVDEEHDPAYKQEEQVIYNARDMAVLRANIENIPICLVSATPSLETMQNVWEKRYAHIVLPERFSSAKMPTIQILDMREHKPQDSRHFIAAPLKVAMTNTLEKGEQSLLFLNRRGYAPLTLCRTCGHRFECPSCSAWLTEHKNKGQLLCHHCAFQIPYPKLCPVCGDTGSLAPCGPGVERIQEEIQEYFPDARIEVLASDLAEHPDTLKAALDRIKNKQIDIIIGTQIIAKGHHFPSLTCVGVIDADLGLEGGDLRACEKTYHLLHQVAGRAGREAINDKSAGQVFLQTWMPDHPVIRTLAAGTRDDFLSAELAMRRQAHMPPFSRLVSLIISGAAEKQSLEIARMIALCAPQNEALKVLGPAPAPLAKIKDQYRFRLLVIADKTLHIQKTLAHWLDHVKVPSTVRVTIDIDPQSFL